MVIDKKKRKRGWSDRRKIWKVRKSDEIDAMFQTWRNAEFHLLSYCLSKFVFSLNTETNCGIVFEETGISGIELNGQSWSWMNCGSDQHWFRKVQVTWNTVFQIQKGRNQEIPHLPHFYSKNVNRLINVNKIRRFHPWKAFEQPSNDDVLFNVKTWRISSISPAMLSFWVSLSLRLYQKIWLSQPSVSFKTK
jgi:hypothetical protein